jgi:DNA-binding transcriptional MerR regulator
VADALTIDELARETGMTVRNIRSHASRGLLPPPEVRARTGYYGPEHVARLRLIQELQANGYNLAAIKHLLSRTDSGSAEEVLGFARALLAPFEQERPEVVDEEELLARFGEVGGKVRSKAVKLGLLVPLGEGRYEVPSPTLLRAADTVVDLGVSPERAIELLEDVSKSADAAASQFVRLFMERIFGGPPDEVRERLERLRPLATEVLVAVFQRRMTERTERAFSRELERGRR